MSTMTAPSTSLAAGVSSAPSQRLLSLDAYRGFIMLMMGSAGFGLKEVAKHFDGGFWPRLANQTGHIAWDGCLFWDLIQPAFMFMVGVAIPFSFARRQQEGHSRLRMAGHAVTRAVALVLLSIFCASAWPLAEGLTHMTNFSFTIVLAQIGLGYVFVVLLWKRGPKVQGIAVAAILVGYWLAFYLFPSPSPDNFDPKAYNLPDDWPVLTGIMAHWNIHANFAGWFDLKFLNLFPRPLPYTLHSELHGDPGGYQTLNFIPSIATMILGLMAGELLRSSQSAKAKFWTLVVSGFVLMALALATGSTVCPIVKRIWTPSWVLFSGAYVVWMLAAFYGAIDVISYGRWAFPLTVVGMNSILIYMMIHLLRPWTWEMIQVHLGWIFQSRAAGAVERFLFGPWGFNPIYMPIVESLSVLFVFWLVLYWLYRQKIFVRI